MTAISCRKETQTGAHSSYLSTHLHLVRQSCITPKGPYGQLVARCLSELHTCVLIFSIAAIYLCSIKVVTSDYYTCLTMAQCPWPVHSVVSNQDFLNAYDDLDLARRNGLNRTRTITWEQTADILLELNTPISLLPEPTDKVRLIYNFKLENIPLCGR